MKKYSFTFEFSGDDYVDESEEGGAENIEIAEKENPKAATKTTPNHDELKESKLSEGKPEDDLVVAEGGKKKKQEKNLGGAKDVNVVPNISFLSSSVSLFLHKIPLISQFLPFLDCFRWRRSWR